MMALLTLLPPGIVGLACDPCGASAVYAEVIGSRHSSGYHSRRITTSGCPNHYSVCTGKALNSVCGRVGTEGMGSEATDQDRQTAVPAYPKLAAQTTDVSCEMVHCHSNQELLFDRGRTIFDLGRTSFVLRSKLALPHSFEIGPAAI